MTTSATSTSRAARTDRKSHRSDRITPVSEINCIHVCGMDRNEVASLAGFVPARVARERDAACLERARGDNERAERVKLASLAGFEPAVFALKGRRVRPTTPQG